MPPAFLLEPLSRDRFEALLSLRDEELVQHNARWIRVDAKPGYPCRVSLVDAEVDERVLLVNFAHHDVSSPYRAAGPIFVRAAAQTAPLRVNEIPEMMRHRELSIRAYDAAAMMVGAGTIHGTALEEEIERFFVNAMVDYLHIHNAGAGCYNCSVRRA